MNISKLSKQQTIHPIGSRYDRKKLENLEEIIIIINWIKYCEGLGTEGGISQTIGRLKNSNLQRICHHTISVDHLKIHHQTQQQF